MTARAITAVVTGLVVLSSVSVATAAQPDRLADRPELLSENRQGIANALATGVLIDPRAEELMARLPVGSCLNDPTLPNCPPARAVMFSEENEYAPLTDPAAEDETATTTDNKAVTTADTDAVTAMQGYYQCAVDMDPEWPYMSSGRVYAWGRNQCSAAAQSQELYMELQKYGQQQGSWIQISTRLIGPAPGGVTISGGTGSDCNSGAVRAWRGRASGYAYVQGVWYTGQEGWFYKNHPCNYP